MLCCPVCRGDLQISGRERHRYLKCIGCNGAYRMVKEIPLMVPPKEPNDEFKRDMQRFWGALYRAAYLEQDERFDREKFTPLLSDLEEMFAHRQHIAAVEMGNADIKGKEVLEIGCGAGAHSALFAAQGAHVTAVDLTPERVLATSRKLDMVDGSGSSGALQADAERLPFGDGAFDLVYSNGVLHHTPDMEGAVREVFRVLKPGGRAVVMLYARHSFQYWVKLFFYQGILRGDLFRHRDWIGGTAEWMSSEAQTVRNPETKVYSGREALELFREFSSVRIRKYGFTFQALPLIGQRISKWLGRYTGYNDGGRLVYGASWRNESAIELKLGRWIGFDLAIETWK